MSLLVFQTLELPNTLHWVSPWPGCRFIIGRAEMRAVVEGLTHRRFLKSHLALGGLPYWESAKYIYVGRDTRDVFMSIWTTRGRTPLSPIVGTRVSQRRESGRDAISDNVRYWEIPSTHP